ncbi:XRE family transcriptional regulator [Fodinicurvata fenggangensis]|uniref:XRE family transcriptional regulator n=1 Tax=Fodinicurvata fenggangensis TaxID=1121830 RepID=UPI001FDFEC14|nr:LexA family transcriptional regulator [Fodinicurvata fenggangensis]
MDETGEIRPHRLGEIVRRWRQAAGLSQPQLAARLGVTQQALAQLEAGQTRAPRYLLQLAQVMDMEPGALAAGQLPPGLARGAQHEATEPAPAPAQPPPPQPAPNVAGPPRPAPLGARDLPVFASAQAGPDGMMVSYDPIEWIERPAPLAGVPDAFAMYVVNDSMEPRYRQGDLLLIHPQRPVRPGKDVLVISRDSLPAEADTALPEEEATAVQVDGDHSAWIKQLVRLDAGQVILRQLNPARDFALPRHRVAGLHLVVGVYYD